VHDFFVQAVDDPRFGKRPPTGPTWARVRSEYPDALDFTTSPDGALTVVVTEEVVYLHASGRTSLGRRLQHVRADASRIVGAQWLEGDDLAKASAAVTRL
jgi:hypothetical protein